MLRRVQCPPPPSSGSWLGWALTLVAALGWQGLGWEVGKGILLRQKPGLLAPRSPTRPGSYAVFLCPKRPLSQPSCLSPSSDPLSGESLLSLIRGERGWPGSWHRSSHPLPPTGQVPDIRYGHPLGGAGRSLPAGLCLWAGTHLGVLVAYDGCNMSGGRRRVGSRPSLLSSMHSPVAAGWPQRCPLPSGDKWWAQEAPPSLPGRERWKVSA